MYLIISLLVFICILLFLKFIPKESNNTIIKNLNKGIKNANECEDFSGYTSAILLISFSWILTIPIIILIIVNYLISIFVKFILKDKL